MLTILTAPFIEICNAWNNASNLERILFVALFLFIVAAIIFTKQTEDVYMVRGHPTNKYPEKRIKAFAPENAAKKYSGNKDFVRFVREEKSGLSFLCYYSSIKKDFVSISCGKEERDMSFNS